MSLLKIFIYLPENNQRLRKKPNELSESYEKVKQKVLNDLAYVFSYYNQDQAESFRIFSGLCDEYGYQRKDIILQHWRSIRSKLNDDKSFEMIVGLHIRKKTGEKLKENKFSYKFGYSDYEIIEEKIPMFKIKMTPDKQFSVESI